jgi:hypothetical protein
MQLTCTALEAWMPREALAYIDIFADAVADGRARPRGGRAQAPDAAQRWRKSGCR